MMGLRGNPPTEPVSEGGGSAKESATRLRPSAETAPADGDEPPSPDAPAHASGTYAARGSQRSTDLPRQERQQRARSRGAAALIKLNDEADRWQRETAPELEGFYLTTIQYVETHLAQWESADQLKPKIEAAAHAYITRDRIARTSSILTVCVGAFLPIVWKLLQKWADTTDLGVALALGAGGGATTLLLQGVLKPRWVAIHADRAKAWEKLLGKLRSRLEAMDARADRSEP